MKKIIFVLSLALFIGGSGHAQEADPLVLVVSEQEIEFQALEAKADKSLQDYLKIVQLANSIARNCQTIGFKGAEDSNTRKVYLRYSLVYFSLAAHYAQTAIDDFDSKSMSREKSKACSKAGFIHRSLGEPKRVYDKRWKDACGLLKEVVSDDTGQNGTSSTATSNELYVDEEFEKTLVGKRLYFKTPKQMFSMNVYEPFIISEEQSTMRSQGQSQFEMALKMMPADKQQELREQMQEKFSRAHWYTFEGDLGGLVFFVQNMETEPQKMICDEADKDSHISYRTSVSGAKACFSNIYKNPQSGERLKSGSSLLQVEHQGEMYSMLLTAGENYNSAKHEKVIKAMARSLRMEGVKELPTVKVRKCKEDATLQLAKGIPVRWTILDRSKGTIILQQPHLARDHEIAFAVRNYYEKMLKLMKGAKDGKQLWKFSKELVVDKQLRKSLTTLGGWSLEHQMKRVDFIPIEVEDYSEFQMDGALTTAAIFYMDALKSASAGVGALGVRLNKMSMKLFWQIPTITIEGECIPQMVCKNGKWVPDYQNLEYREIKRTKGEISSPNKDFMTVREIERDLERYFKVELDKVERAEADYASVMNRCVDSRGKLYDIDFPVNIDKCPKLENQIVQNQYETLLLEKIQDARKKEMTRWLQKLKPAEIKKYQTRIAELDTQIAEMQVELRKLIVLRDGHIQNGNTGQANEYKLKVQFLEEDIALAQTFVRASNIDLDSVSSGKREAAISRELQEISGEIANLKKAKKRLKSELAICVEQYEKVR